MHRSRRHDGNILFPAPGLSDDGETDIYDLLTDALAETALLTISYRNGPNAWLADLRTHAGGLPADLGFLDVGGTTRSTAGPTSGGEAAPFPFVDAVANPGDLTELGIQISTYLERWAGTDHQIVVYVDSLIALL